MPLRILIVDDNEVARGLLREALTAHSDWNVCGEASNGLEAVALANELKPNLIVMDMAMPEMDGLHASQEILKALPGVPIILHTMHTGEQVTIVAKQMGIRRVVGKTAPPGELETAIEECVAERTEIPFASTQAESGSDGTEATKLRALEAAAASGAPSAPAADPGAPSDSPKVN